jgi:hypothetical protein
MATAPGWTMGSRRSRRLGALPYVGVGPWKARPRRSPFAGKWTAGMWPSPVPPWPMGSRLRARASFGCGRCACSVPSGGCRGASRQPLAAQGGHTAGQGAPESAPGAAGLPPQGGTRPGRQYDTIYHKDLQLPNMVRNHHLAKSISDAGWSGLSIPSFKAAYAGKTVVAAPGVHLASLFGLRRVGAQGLVRPLASLPGLWDQSAPRS